MIFGIVAIAVFLLIVGFVAGMTYAGQQMHKVLARMSPAELDAIAQAVVKERSRGNV